MDTKESSFYYETSIDKKDFDENERKKIEADDRARMAARAKLQAATNNAASPGVDDVIIPGQEDFTKKAKEDAKKAEDEKKKAEDRKKQLEQNRKSAEGIQDSLSKLMSFKDYKDYEKQEKAAIEAQVAENSKYIYGQSISDGQIPSILGSFSPSTVSKIFGMPYQWMPEVDRRVKGTGRFGRKFYEKILTKMPILVVTPGLPDFMGGYGDDKKKPLLQSLLAGTGVSLDDIRSSNNKPLRYYTLRFATSQYYDYVNSMCSALAVFLGINNVEYNGSTLGNTAWQDNQEISKLYSYHGGIGFYLNSETQLSENFSNSSTQSKLASTVNEISSIAREVQFLTGISGIGTDLFLSNNLAADPNNTKSLVDGEMIGSKLGNFGNFVKMIADGTKTVFNGGKLEFPELWEDSSYSNSYNISLKLISPDYDKVSWFINIGVPLMHLIALACPRQVDPNGYVSPFLCRAFYKGFFNIDMGLLSLAVQRGTEGGWTVDGLPTVVEVTLEIKDLYSNMSISHSLLKNGKDIGALDNMAMMTYLANMAGVNINEPDITRSLRLYAALAKQEVLTIPSQILTKANQYFADLLTNKIWINNSIR